MDYFLMWGVAVKTLFKGIRILVSSMLWLTAVSGAFSATSDAYSSSSRVFFVGLAFVSGWVAAKVWPPKSVEVISTSKRTEPPNQHPIKKSFVPAPPKKHLRQKKVAARWHPFDEAVQIGTHSVGAGAIYVGSDLGSKRWRSTIDPSLEISQSYPDVNGVTMGYWPSYSGIAPEARLAYLTWLANGRTQSINIGYVFLFFYGLERRIFVDHASEEVGIVRDEVHRLLKIYGENHSFTQYSLRFVDALDGAIARDEKRAPRLPKISSPPTGYDFPLSVRVEIGKKLLEAPFLDADWMFAWYANHPETGFRVPAQRAFLHYKALLLMRFRKKYPQGQKISIPKKRIVENYHAASGDFNVEISADIPDVIHLEKSLNVVAAISESCQDDLAKYSRYIGKYPQHKFSVKAHALLPIELALALKTPQINEIQLWLDSLVPKRMGVIICKDLLDKFDLELGKGTRVPKTTMQQTADILKVFGFAVEPDPSSSGYCPKPLEPVIIFQVPPDAEHKLSRAFDFAALSLTLLIAVAQVDGHIDSTEFKLISDGIAKNPNISDFERSHLAARAVWLSKVPVSLSKLKKPFGDLEKPQRHYLADLAVEMSMADGKIATSEMKLLEKMYAFLGFDKTEVYSVVHQMQSGSNSEQTELNGPMSIRPETPTIDYSIPKETSRNQSKQFSLDSGAIEKIRDETKLVSSLLAEVFDSGEDLEEKTDIPENTEQEIPVLDRRHIALKDALLDVQQWTREDFDQLCNSFALLPDGALETINEWAYEVFDEPLLEEHDGIHVNKDILHE